MQNRESLRTVGLTLVLILLSANAAARAEENGIWGTSPPMGDWDPQGESEMDDLAAADEVAKFIAGLKTDWTVFVADRKLSIRQAKGLPKRWLADLAGYTELFKGTVCPGEFYVFQFGAFAAKRDIGKIGVSFGDLKGQHGIIGRDRLRCFNLGGVDNHGVPFTKDVYVPAGNVQALWIGVDVPSDAKGLCQGTIKVRDFIGGGEMDVAVELTVEGDVLKDHGDSDSWRLSRLRWLDSTIGMDDDTVTHPYLPIQRDKGTFKILGRDLALDRDGLPQQIRSFFNGSNTAITQGDGFPLLAAPFRFVVETDNGPVKFEPAKITLLRELKGALNWRAVSQAPGIELTVEGLLEYDGFANYRCQIQSSTPVKVKDIRLEFAVAPEAATYFMGLGKAGGKCPESIDWKWNPEFNQDGFWIGAVNVGFKIQLYGANWQMPLINCYYHSREIKVPESWGGADSKSGGIRLAKSANGTVQAVAYSGPRDFAPDQPLAFHFNLFLTPFHTLDTDQQWTMRHLHKGQGVDDEDYRDLKRVKAMGANVINIHHNKEQNPTINYPYFDMSLPLLKQCVADAHANDIKVKIYYTTRELTCNLPELYAFWSLNGEIICASPGKDGMNAGKWNYNGLGPHPWLVKRLGKTGYIPAWREIIGGRYRNMLDLAVVTTPDSRMDNFYLEGLAFTLQKTDFDGVYIDDTALDRKAFQRAHRIFEKAGKPFLADNHSWSHFNKHAGMTPSAYCYLQNFPYFHRLWYGEAFNYNTPPDYWLVEMSGIPFGLMSEMLAGGGNPWRGICFGMTGRLGLGGDAQPMWKLWDEFEMNGTEMIGFWDPACPVRTGRDDILATVYRKQGKALVAIASWAKEATQVHLQVDWKALGLDPKRTRLHAPACERLQPTAEFGPGSVIPIEVGRGRIICID